MVFTPEIHYQWSVRLEKILELHKQLTSANTDHDKTVIQRQIDQLVYELYGLTEEKIKIAEEGLT